MACLGSALARLQVYGASFAVVGAGGALAAIFGPSIKPWGWQLALVILIAAAGAVAYLVVRRALEDPSPRPPNDSGPDR